jgi:hypothetical protein
MNMKRWLLLIPFLSLLAGCFQDTASYSLGSADRAIVLVRNQTWPFQSTVDVSVIESNLPDCNGGGDIKGVAEDSAYELYQAPDEYPEPILMLKVGQRVFALSTQSCRMQEFPAMPDDLGQKLGAFMVKDGKFQFVGAGA